MSQYFPFFPDFSQIFTKSFKTICPRGIQMERVYKVNLYILIYQIDERDLAIRTNFQIFVIRT